MNFNGSVIVGPKRPPWWRQSPDVSIDCREARPDKPPLITTIMQGARHLAPGQILSFRLDYEPALLYRMLEEMGFEHWSEAIEDGQWRIDVRSPLSQHRERS